MARSPTQLLRATGSVLGSNLVVAALGGITSVVVARAIGPEGRGAVSALLAIPAMVVSLGNLGLRQAAVFALGQGRHGLQAVVGTLVALGLGLSLAGMVVTGLVAGLGEGRVFAPDLVGIATLMVPAAICVQYATGVFLARQELAAVNRLQWLPTLVRFGVVLLAISVTRVGVVHVLVAYVVAQLVSAAAALRGVGGIASLRPRLMPDVARDLVGLGIRYAVALFVLQVHLQVDLLLLAGLGSLRDVGTYSVAVSLAQLVWQLPSALGLVVFARSAGSEDRVETTREVGRALRATILAGLVACGALFAAAPVLVPLVFGADYSSAASSVRLILPGVLAYSAFKVLNADVAGRGRPGLSLAVFVPATLLNVGLNLALIPRYGADGAAVATSLSYGAGALVFLLAYARVAQVGVGELVVPRRSDLEQVVSAVRRLASRGPRSSAGA